MQGLKAKPIFEFVGGALCLDFANTVDDRLSEERVKDLVPGFPALVCWARQAGVIPVDAGKRLGRRASRRPAEAARELERAHRLREAIFRIFSRHAAGQAPARADLATLNTELSLAFQHLRVERWRQDFGWRWDSSAGEFDPILWPVVRSAAELLTSSHLARVRTCGARDCGWLFLDTSRNHSRRWCKMQSCGNRDKVRRHYLKVREKRPQHGHPTK
ncbi:MAG: CGNR zinc finger domain-containing protein [Terriglobia bacterium]